MRVLHSRNFDNVQNCRRAQLKRFVTNDYRSRNPTNEILIENYRFKLWKSAVNIANLLMKIRLTDRITFFQTVLIPLLSFQVANMCQFERKCKQLIRLRPYKFENELRALYQSEMGLERALNNNTNPHNNHQPNAVVIRQRTKVCSKCLRSENVTKCCTHCHRFFDEVCFADIQRNNNDPENLCPDCDTHDAVMERIAPKCGSCNVNFTQFNADNLVKCIFHKCPITYHRDCVPAGAELLSNENDTIQIICTKHNDSKDNSDKLNICGLCCQKSSSLMKCSFCPISFHTRNCLKSTKNIPAICEICQEGRVLLNGDYIYVSHNRKWWPAKIVPKEDVPERVLRSQKMHKRHGSGYFWIKILEKEQFQWKHQSDVLTPSQINDDLAETMRGIAKNGLLDKAIKAIKAVVNYLR